MLEPVEKQVPSWEQATANLPQRGEPGFAQDGPRLMLYDADGLLVGLGIVLSPIDAAIYSHPERPREGLGTEVLREAMQRYELDFANMPMTPEGQALVVAVVGAD